jgi:hypothetical protein
MPIIKETDFLIIKDDGTIITKSDTYNIDVYPKDAEEELVYNSDFTSTSDDKAIKYGQKNAVKYLDGLYNHDYDMYTLEYKVTNYVWSSEKGYSLASRVIHCGMLMDGVTERYFDEYM